MLSDTALLEIKGLQTHFLLDEGTVKAVENADLLVPRGGTIGIVGESGCGKTVMAYSILQLVESPGKIVGGEVLFQRKVNRVPAENNGGEALAEFEEIDLTALKPNSREMRSIRGDQIAMIFQEPMTSLSPVHTIGDQILEVITVHRPISKAEARSQAIEMLERVGIPNAQKRIDLFPFQLSGGMRQRAMIAMALACHPSLLIADEPTTALDVTTQAQILELMLELQRDMGMAIMMITHNLGVVAEICDQVAVMYLGQVVEQSSVYDLFGKPMHPYTQALLHSIPRLGLSRNKRLDPITGAVPDPYNRPSGCPFHPRCGKAITGLCGSELPPVITDPHGRMVRCWLYK